jgi:DNA-binding CsgD family transcriptional regulator
VLILTTFDLDEYVLDALRAGASGFLLKDVPPEDLVAAIRVVARGDALLAPTVTRRLLDRMAGRLPGVATRPLALAELTDRETEILAAAADGETAAQTGERLFLSSETVKGYRKRIIAKLGARNGTHAVALALRSGLLPLRMQQPQPVAEVARLAKLGTMPRPLLEIILANGAWLQAGQVRRALLSNPRLSPEMVHRVLELMPRVELKLVPQQTAYPGPVRAAAKRMLKPGS